MKNKLFPNKYNRIKFKFRMKKEYVSVIIPVYKDYVGLQDTLESLSRQTLAKSKYEIIVANDGADKKISEVCKKYRVKEVKIAKNKGSYNARNTALAESRGEYIAFTDADVLCPEKWLENGIKSLKKVDYLGGPVKFKIKKKLNFADKYENLFEFKIKQAFENEFFCPTANVFTKRKVIKHIGGFDVRLKSSGDRELGNRIHFHSNIKQKYESDNSVIHPHRNYYEVVIKIRRIAMGWNDLVEYYPDRFKHYTYILFDDIIYSLIPPYKYYYDKGLFFFLWQLKFVCLYINIKYRYKNMKIINSKSRIFKIIYFIKKLNRKYN